MRFAGNGPPATRGEMFSTTVRGVMVASSTADLGIAAAVTGRSAGQGTIRTSPAFSGTASDSSAIGAGRSLARSVLIRTSRSRSFISSAATLLPGPVRLRILPPPISANAAEIASASGGGPAMFGSVVGKRALSG